MGLHRFGTAADEYDSVNYIVNVQFSQIVSSARIKVGLKSLSTILLMFNFLIIGRKDIIVTSYWPIWYFQLGGFVVNIRFDMTFMVSI